MKAFWEVAIAAVCRREDAELTRTLFASDDPRLNAYACEIVIGAGSKHWLRELAALQDFSNPCSGKATEAIASCHRAEGLAALKKSFGAAAVQMVKELEARARLGSPRRIDEYAP